MSFVSRQVIFLELTGAGLKVVYDSYAQFKVVRVRVRVSVRVRVWASVRVSVRVRVRVSVRFTNATPPWAHGGRFPYSYGEGGAWVMVKVTG